MKALVIYDPRCKNSKLVSDTVTYALQTTLHAHSLPADEVIAADIEDVDLVVFGCRTRPHSPTMADMLLDHIPETALAGKQIALFDTVLEGWRRLVRSEAETLAWKFVHHGAVLALPVTSFEVPNVAQPPTEHELWRAGNWARAIQQQLQLLPF